MAFFQSLIIGLLLFMATVGLGLGILYILSRSKQKTLREYLQDLNRSSQEHNRTALEDVIAQRQKSFAKMDDDTFRKYVQGVLKQTAFHLEPAKEPSPFPLRAIHQGSGETFPVWCKAASEDIAAAEVTSFHQLLVSQGAKGGLFITSTSFSQEAKDLLKRWEHIKGIDSKSLLEIFRKTVADPS